MSLEGHTVLALIPARSGSKRVTGKNTRLLGGKPLIEWTIEAALASAHVDSVVVSTDDTKVMSLASKFPLSVLERPMHLASDSTPTASVIVHALVASPPHGIVILLQPTSPFRSASHIDTALELLMTVPAEAVISARRIQERPELVRVGIQGDLIPLSGSSPPQDRTVELFALNGALYTAKATDLLRVKGEFASLRSHVFPMSDVDSIDIDTYEDLAAARRVLRRSSK